MAGAEEAVDAGFTDLPTSHDEQADGDQHRKRTHQFHLIQTSTAGTRFPVAIGA